MAEIRSDEIRDEPGVRWLVAPLTEQVNRELGHLAAELPGVAEFGELQGEGAPTPPPRVYELNAQAVIVVVNKQAAEATPLVRVFRKQGDGVEECQIHIPAAAAPQPRKRKMANKKALRARAHVP